VVHVQRTIKVDVDDLFPQIRIAVEERLDLVPAGVVHQHVDRATGLERGHRLVHLGAIGDVHLVSLGFSAGALDQTGRFLRAAFIHVEDRNLGTFFAEPFAHRAPDSAAATSHDDTFSIQPAHMDVLLFR